MTQTAHTPAPWRMVRNYHGVFNVVGPDDDDGYSAKVALINNKHEANARLIAAAPDLLEALKRALNFIANTESEMGEPLECGDMARAAIAKAKGGVE